mmetsp:Transcript_14245/g.42002  ORF Transcript_14245/g.42002 Transcript_14245/m.42002 type:complete len:214 (+) Transcript_14245:2070-2711(+)
MAARRSGGVARGGSSRRRRKQRSRGRWQPQLGHVHCCRRRRYGLVATGRVLPGLLQRLRVVLKRALLRPYVARFQAGCEKQLLISLRSWPKLLFRTLHGHIRRPLDDLSLFNSGRSVRLHSLGRHWILVCWCCPCGRDGLDGHGASLCGRRRLGHTHGARQGMGLLTHGVGRGGGGNFFRAWKGLHRRRRRRRRRGCLLSSRWLGTAPSSCGG